MTLQGFCRHKKKCSSTSSAEQPASASTAALLSAAIANEQLLAIAGYVGAHNLESIWECSECSPHWYGWYCHECQLHIKYLQWTNPMHFGYCQRAKDYDEPYSELFVHFCGCCRSRRDGSGCEARDDLGVLKATCHTMRDLLKTYGGT